MSDIHADEKVGRSIQETFSTNKNDDKIINQGIIPTKKLTVNINTCATCSASSAPPAV